MRARHSSLALAMADVVAAVGAGVRGARRSCRRRPRAIRSRTRVAAENFLKRQRYEDAIRQAKLALGRDERYVPAMMVLAKAYYYQRKYELATSIIDIAKSIDPNNAECYNLLGFIALTRDDRISATAAFKKATELDARYGNAWDNLAAQYLFGKNYDGALEAAQKATQLLPHVPQGVEQPRLGAIAASSNTPSRRAPTSGRRSSIRTTPTPTSTSASSISTPSRCRGPISSPSSTRRSTISTSTSSSPAIG